MPQLGHLLPLSLIVAAATTACASDPSRPKTEDGARLLAPLPACVTTLSGSRAAPKGMTRSLRGEYWKVVFPGFDDKHQKLPGNALTCTGRPLLREPAFERASPVEATDDTAITLGGGADGIKAVWLRSHRDAQGTLSGALALVRARDDLATVFAIGTYQGRAGTKLSLERLDHELVVLAHDDGCTGRQPSQRCDTMLTVYLVRQGRLVQAARLALERVEYDVDSEPPNRGRFEYHLTASASFSKGMLHVLEHVSVRAQDGREVRWAEQDRVFIVDDSRLEPSEEPLWARVFRPTVAGQK